MKDKNEALTIRERKRQAYVTSLVYRIFRIFPVKKNKIVFTAFEGDGGFCCNPKYIAKELLDRNKQYELIWLVNNMERRFPKGIRKVKNTFLNRAYHLTTAKVWVDNSRKAYGTGKRNNQMYIQTWHAAIEFKAVGKYRGSLLPKMAYLVSRYDSKLADYMISNSEWCTKRYPKMLLYDGKVLKTGSPRCDFLVTKRGILYQRIRKHYGIPVNAKIVMYAPTFRGGSQKGKRQVYVETPTLDFEKLTFALGKKFGGEWFVFLRLHPQLAALMDQLPMNEKTRQMIDVSQADDMNEIMAAADVLITDYSSAAFDAANVFMPVFLYCDDLDAYIKDRGSLMWDMNKLPFPIAQTNEQLQENVMKFDTEKYKNELEMFFEKHGVLEDGHASERVVNVIEKFVRDK